MNEIDLIAAFEGEQILYPLPVLNPQISSVSWSVEEAGDAVTEIKYGKRHYINVETWEACGMNILVRIHCDNWRQEDRFMTESLGEIGMDAHVTSFEFTADANWLTDRGLHESEVTTEVYLFYTRQNNSFQNTDYDGYYNRGIDWYNSQGPQYCYNLATDYAVIMTGETGIDTITVKKIVIVIDPGHGWKDGGSGTQCRGFEYYDKKNDGLPDKTKILKAKAKDLPPHVLNDVNTWIKAWYNCSVTKEEQEWFYVIDICLLLQEELERDDNYVVLMTREVVADPANRVQLPGQDTYTARHTVPNENEADYYISVHCDGQGSHQLTGAFVLYPRNKDTNSNMDDVDKSRLFGQDLMDHYTALNHAPSPVKQPADNDGKFVINSGNRTKRRIIIELGRMTNPNDIIALYRNGIQATMARQITAGLTFNVQNRFLNE